MPLRQEKTGTCVPIFFCRIGLTHIVKEKPQRKKSDQKAVSGDALVSSASVWLCGRSSEGDQYGKMVEVGNVFGFVAGNVV